MEGRVTRARERVVAAIRWISGVDGVPREEGRCPTNGGTHVRVTPPSILWHGTHLAWNASGMEGRARQRNGFGEANEKAYSKATL